jgi:predicted kinase
VPRAPGTGAEAQLGRETKNVNQRKLTEKELPKAVGKGPWDAAVADTVKGLRDGSIDITDTHYRTPQGTYTPERIELHARIIRALLQGAGAHPGDKTAIFLAGGPASGKSTLLREGHVKPPEDAVQINPDIIKTMLPEYAALIAAGDPEASSKVHEESSHIAKWLQNLAMAREHHVVVDGTGNSEPGKFASKIQRTVDHGYETSVHYATIPTDEAIRRSEERAKNPKSESYGRRVPLGFLRTAHSHVSRSFAHDVSQMKDVSVHVFDTSGKKPKRIYEKHAGSAGKVVHKKRYDQFVAKQHEVKRGG